MPPAPTPARTAAPRASPAPVDRVLEPCDSSAMPDSPRLSPLAPGRHRPPDARHPPGHARQRRDADGAPGRDRRGPAPRAVFQRHRRAARRPRPAGRRARRAAPRLRAPLGSAARPDGDPLLGRHQPLDGGRLRRRLRAGAGARRRPRSRGRCAPPRRWRRPTGVSSRSPTTCSGDGTGAWWTRSPPSAAARTAYEGRPFTLSLG